MPETSPPRSIRLGVLTPSSNTVLEPLTSAIVAEADGVTAHFARFPVTEISLSPQGLRQFDREPMLAAARLLADARVDVIVWSGTSAGWLGFESDDALIGEITRATGIPATTSVLALNEAIAELGAGTLGLFTPYTADVHARIVENYAALGVTVVSERNLGIAENFAFSQISPELIEEILRELAEARPDVLVTFCTNLGAAQLAPVIEAATGIPLLDTVATCIWKGLGMAGVHGAVSPATWGRLFALGLQPAGSAT